MQQDDLNLEELEALKAIFYRKHIGITRLLVTKLIEGGYISFRFPRGYAPTNKGREYLSKFSDLQDL